MQSSKPDFVIVIDAVNDWPTAKSSNLMQLMQIGWLLYLRAANYPYAAVFQPFADEL
jgi:hypothetical protein